MKAEKYKRGEGNQTNKIRDKKLKMQLTRAEKLMQEATLKAAQSEILLPRYVENSNTWS